MIADSHVYAYDFIKEHLEENPGKEAHVYNVDFHHDTYINTPTGSNEVNCGNWLRRLQEEKIITKAYWAARPDSEREDSLAEEVPFKDLTKLKFDAIFICRSSWWTPPHLDKDFIKYFAEPLIDNGIGWFVKYEQDIDKSRYNKDFLSGVSQMEKAYRTLYSVNKERAAK